MTYAYQYFEAFSLMLECTKAPATPTPDYDNILEEFGIERFY